MAPQHFNRVQKKWIAEQLRRAASLKTLAGVRKYQKSLLDTILDSEKDTQLRSLTTGEATFNQVLEIFSLKLSRTRWAQLEETHNTPKFLIYSLKLLKKAIYDTSSEAYNRIAIDYLIVSCIAKHRDILSSLSTNDPKTTTAHILEQSDLSTNSPNDQATKIAQPLCPIPTTPLIAPKSTSQPLPIKVFPEMSLFVQVEKNGQVWQVTGIADWAMGYGDRAVLEDGTILLAIEAKQEEKVSNGESQLLAYLATIRQLRIQAGKKNVMTQGFFSDGRRYQFICIRNNGTVMLSAYYDISFDGELKSVFNFLLGMLNTVAESSPNTSPTKPGLEQDEEIENFDRDVFVRIFKDEDVNFDIPAPIFDHVEEMEEAEWSDVPLPEEEE